MSTSLAENCLASGERSSLFVKGKEKKVLQLQSLIVVDVRCNKENKLENLATNHVFLQTINFNDYS